jgi:inorganic pyrophosphatase
MNLDKLSSGKNVPSEINVVIEIPQGSSIKYELDKESGAVRVDRFLHTPMAFPFNYGFIPHTLSKDGDPVDVVLISSMPIVPGAVIAARPVGILEMEDEAGLDNKIIALPIEKIDPYFAEVKEITEVNQHLKDQIKHFFEHYKDLEPNKWVKIKNFLPKEVAEEEIKNSIEK